MTLCEFCILEENIGLCANRRPIPKKMRCVDFTPSIERFCASPGDFTGEGQLRQMATYFGLAGKELKRVLALASRKPASYGNQENINE